MKFLLCVTFVYIPFLALGASVNKPLFDNIIMKGSVTENYCVRADTKTCDMILKDAKSFCASQNEHLPSARELSALAMSYGAKGILEVDDYLVRSSSGEKLEAYSLIESTQDGESIDRFYFSSLGFKDPNSEANNLWSSSGKPYSAFAHFIMSNGAFAQTMTEWGSPHSVRCVLNK